MKKHEPTLHAVSQQITLLSEQISERFDSIEHRLREHHQRFDKIENKLSEHDQRFDVIDKKLLEHDQRFGVVDQRFGQLDYKIDSLAIVTNKHLASFDGRLHKVEVLTAGQ